MVKPFGPSLSLTPWSLGLPVWRAPARLLAVHAILVVVRARARGVP